MANDATDKGAQGNTDNAGVDAAAKAAADKAAADKTAADAAAAAGAKGGKADLDAEATAKADADKKAAEDAEAAKNTGAPAKYELKVPDDSPFFEFNLEAFETIARENNLTNEQAQAALDREQERLNEQSTRFAETTKADKVYGGDKLDTTQRLSNAAIDLVRPKSHPRSKAFREILDKSGFGNHIEIVSFLADLGKRLEEDGAVAGATGGSSGGEKRTEDILYDAPTSKS